MEDDGGNIGTEPEESLWVLFVVAVLILVIVGLTYFLV